MRSPSTSYSSIEDVTPWPIIKSQNVILSEDQMQHTLEVARHLQNENVELTQPWSKTSGVSKGWSPGPTLYLEDHRPVDLVSENSAKAFEYRMLGLAGDGDVYLLSGISDSIFEKYFNHKVGLGTPKILNLAMEDNHEVCEMASACRESKTVLNTLVKMTKKKGVLNIAPYQVTKEVWLLAEEISMLSGCPVNVVGPNPELSQIANDKLWFTKLARLLLGQGAVPITYEVNSITSAANHIVDLAKKHTKLVLKIPTSAGGLGNITILSNDIRNMSLKDIHKSLSSTLESKGWVEGKALLIGVWDDHVISSPSVQIWIPKIFEGPPIIEGVFEQAVKGVVGVFVGAKPAALDPEITQLIVSEAAQIAQTMQYIGYYGRLSLDTILMDPPDRKKKVHWIEANARWGGVSIPMTIGNKMLSNDHSNSVMVLQISSSQSDDVSLKEKLLEHGIQEISLNKGITKGFIQLLPSSEPLELMAVYGLNEAEIKSISAI